MTNRATGASAAVFQQEELRLETAKIVGTAMLKELRKIDISYTLRDAGIIYVSLFGTLAVTCHLHSRFGWRALLAAPILALVCGVAFNWINVQIHEASHYSLFANKRLNDVFCDLVLGALALQDVQTYRSTHGMHHSQLHTDRDPDLWTYSSHLGSVRETLVGLGRDLLLLSAFRRRRQVAEFLRLHCRGSRRAPKYSGPAKALAQSCVIALLVGACGAWGLVYYVVIYLYGLLGVFPALIRVRTVVQHREGQLDSRETPGLVAFTSRTTEAPFWEFFLLGARMDYHFEHHLHPNIPYYNLKKMHRILDSAGLFEAIRTRTGQELRTDDYVRTFVKLATA